MSERISLRKKIKMKQYRKLKHAIRQGRKYERKNHLHRRAGIQNGEVKLNTKK